ncbi:MAG: SgcJ/EcaC family oxidoreductase [Planctomycetota bacterium]|jgi:uncharacterized protein (TIGR02246 family)
MRGEDGEWRLRLAHNTPSAPLDPVENEGAFAEKQVLALVAAFNARLGQHDGEAVASLFDEDGDAYLADGRTTLRGAGLARLGLEEVEPDGLQRTVIRAHLLASDAALVVQRAVALDGVPQQESILLVRRDGSWRIRHYQVTRLATWAAQFVADRSAVATDATEPEVIRAALDGPALGTVSPEDADQIRRAIEALMARHERSYNEASAEQYAACFTEEAALLPAGGQAVLLGRETVLRTVGRAEESFRTMDVRLQVENLAILGPRLAVCRVGGVVLQRDGSEHDFPGFKVGLWYRIAMQQADGTWRFQLQHNTPPEAAADARPGS